jgi:hypothetical protein
MHSRYILKYILIKQDSDLFESINYIKDNYPNLKIRHIKEDGKYYRIKQINLSNKYFPILNEQITDNISFLYYYDNHFALNCSPVR